MMLKTITLVLLSAQIYANVWNSTRKWNESDIIGFKNWVSTSLERDIFSSKDSPYYGIKTDCADAIFAYMAIYSLENDLYFQLKLDHNNFIDNNSNKFDKYPESERLKKLIHHIGSSAGTYSLAYFNSYPVSIDDISAGDIYVTEWRKNGALNRHAYMIKKFLPTGHFELYSSTTPVKVRKLALRKGMPLHLFESSPWGFKRLAPHYLINKDLIDISRNQYTAKKSWGKNFMSKLSKRIATEKDSINLNLKRRLSNICDMLTGRESEVQEAIQYKEEISRCMNSKEYYEYSTPSRDNSIQSAMTGLLIGWKKIRKASLNEVDTNITSALEYFLGKTKDQDAREDLFSICPLVIEESSFTMRDFFMLKRSSKISSNPNDPYRMRWGLNGSKSSCPKY